MSRYSQIKITIGPNPIQDPKDKQPRYINVKYPEIYRSENDIYVFTAVGDRYDTLSSSYYNDSSLWWIISSANYDSPYDSLLPDIGIQLRIPSPSRLNEIIANYELINN